MRSSRLTLESLEDRSLMAVALAELPVPGGSILLEGVTTGPDGNLWYTSFNSGKIGRITPAGAVTEFDASTTPNSGPVGITTGPDGNLWYTLKNVSKIGRITPAGVVTEFVAGSTPVTGPEGITAGPDGNVWFTQRFAGRIARITMDGVVTEFAITTSAAPQPVGITTGWDGNLWFVEYAANRVGRITAAGQITEYDLPTPNSGPFMIATGPDGNLWFTERNSHQIGRLTADGRTMHEFPLPTANAHPVGITPGPDGNVWFTERNGNKVGQITLAGRITEFAVPTENGQPYAITFGPRRNVVFTQLGATANRVGLVNGVVSAEHGFIQGLYRKALHRFASPPELENWAFYLGRTNTWVVANAIERSHEARTKLVKRWYVQHLGRSAGAGEEQHWVQLMFGGVTEEQVLAAILGSPEYYGRAPYIVGTRPTPSDEYFIRALYRQVLGRDAGEAEVAAFRTHFLPAVGRQGSVWVILNSEEHRGNVVRSYYRDLLGRQANPGTNEVRAWVYARPWHDLTMIRTGFEASGEFYQNG